MTMKNLFSENIRHIAVIAPAGPSSQQAVEAGALLLRNSGIKVSIMPHVFSGSEEEYLSAPAAGRVADLHACWLDQTVDLAICARGGYGAAQLLPLLDWQLLQSRPQLPLIGYSDITALHMAMLKHQAGTPIVAPMAAKLHSALIEDKNRAYNQKYLHAAFCSEAVTVIPPSGEPAMRVLQKGNATGLPVAANLAVLTSLCGTAYLPDFAGRILLLEDINEPPYKLDRMLTQLSQNGIFAACAGLVFGGFDACGEALELKRLFNRFAAEVNGPVIAGFPFGHRLMPAALNMAKMMQVTANHTVEVIA